MFTKIKHILLDTINLRNTYEDWKIIRTISKSGKFDKDTYIQNYPDVKKTGLNPIAHYVKHGAKKGFQPNKSFDGTKYLKANPDVNQAGLNPFFHYIKHGEAENRPLDHSIILEPTEVVRFV